MPLPQNLMDSNSIIGKKASAEDKWIVLKNVLKLAPGVFSRESIERLLQKGFLDYSFAEEAFSIVDAYTMFNKGSEGVQHENLVGDDLTNNKYDQDFIQNLGIQRVKIDTALQLASAKKDNRLNTIRDVANELDELTKQVISDYSNYEGEIMDDIKSIFDDPDELNVIKKISNTQVRTILDDDGGEKKFNATDMQDR